VLTRCDACTASVHTWCGDKQGATCYLNAVLQQLYHVPGFCGPLLGMSGDGRKEHEQDEVVGSYF
jgi:hypothetical protein